jgi:hypothetical protein
MANAIVTRQARANMVKARSGEIQLPTIAKMAFGDGGVDGQGNVRVPTEDQAALNHELLRKSISGYEVVSDVDYRYKCTIENTELVGANISELALIDSNDDIIAIKNFLPKGKDSDLEMEFQMDDTF